jgi:hypothetical protein
MARTSAVALALLVLLAGCGGGGGGPGFEQAAGWTVLSGHGQLAAANVPFAARDRSLTSPPGRTVATLPRRGVVIWGLVSPAAKHRRTPLPLRLSEGTRSNPIEGTGCAPAVPLSRCFAASGSVRHLGGRLAGYDVDLFVFLGTDRPSPAQVAAVDAELARLRA